MDLQFLFSPSWKAELDGLSTSTSVEQAKVEDGLADKFEQMKRDGFDWTQLELYREEHIDYILSGIEGLGPGYSSLDCGRPWFCFWMLHGLDLLGEDTTQFTQRTIDFLSRCQDFEKGGYGGGPGQLSHLAPTYAAVASLAVVGTEEAYNSVNREAMYRFLMSVKNKDGSFAMHHGGETDVRGVYCCLVVATMLNILTDELIEGTADFLSRCQTYEGGLGGEPGVEAHGGYTFCGLAAALLLPSHSLDLQRLAHWACHRQMALEGGFQGRTNKLVDSCYSFWQGAIFQLLDMEMDSTAPLLHQEALQAYCLIFAQEMHGGLRDKPGKPRDFYHTCYALSGLSAAQHSSSGPTVLGAPSNLLQPISPLFNVTVDKAKKITEYFADRPFRPPSTSSSASE